MTRGKPRFDTKAERVRFAIRKKYLDEENWTNADIASELNVSEEVVSRYLNRTPQAREVQRARSVIETEQWKQLLVDLTQRIDKLAELERQLWEVVEPAVTAYRFPEVEAEIANFHLQDGGNSLALEIDEEHRPEERIQVPVPENWREVPEFSRLRQVWKERRRTEDQLNNLLGLDADETLRLEGELTERKVWAVESDEYPETEPAPIDGGDEQEEP